MLYLAGQFAKYRGKTAAATDQRVRHISEIIDGISQVKSYAWETPFFDMVTKFRAREVLLITGSQSLRSINQGLMFSTPALVSLVTFGVFWGSGGDLTVPVVFATISLLQVLRMTIGRMWSRSIETGSDAIASCHRIESFLDRVYQSESITKIDENQNNSRCSQLPLDEPCDDDVGQCRSDVQVASPRSDYHSIFQNDIESMESKPAVADKIANADVDNDLFLSLHATSCSYGSTSILKNINLQLRRGRVTMVVGAVGCGKSSLLSAVLGEMRIGDGDKRVVSSNCRLAYCAQRAWILAASVRANVAIAGQQNRNKNANFKVPTNLDEDLYKASLESTLLVDDIVRWPAYDETEIGERGVSISGGQRARISLARAVYSDADVFLLDDPLSAVDVHVGKALMNRCILQQLRARGKAVLLVTHQLQYLSMADEVLVLGKTGEQLFIGSYEEFLMKKDDFKFLEVGETNSSNNNNDEEEIVDGGYGDGGLSSREEMNHTPPKIEYDKDFLVKRRAAAQSSTEGESKAVDVTVVVETEDEARRRQIIALEEKKIGDISLQVYWNYLCAGGSVQGIFVLSLIFFSQGLLMITDYWVRWWATSSFGPQSSFVYLLVLGLLVLLCIFAGFYRAFAWFQFSLKAASKLHERCFWAVLHSPLSFFIANPTGRILNRFAKDQNQVDELLPVTFFSFLESTVFCIAGIVLVCITIPWLVLLLPALLIIFVYLRRKYMASTREIKRWEAVTRSPIFSDFSSTLEGLVTLRAFNLRQSVTAVFLKQLDINGRAWFSFLMASRWLGYRLDMESAAILAFVALFAVWLRTQIDVGLIGFALTYTMSLSGLFQWSVRLSAEVESQMTAVERIQSYGELPAEIGYLHGGSLHKHREILEEKAHQHEHHHDLLHLLDPVRRKKSDAPSVELTPNPSGQTSLQQSHPGSLRISNLTVRYRKDLEPVLRDVSLDIPGGSKVGICGRTGSGKSSTLLALLRLNLISNGDVLVDGESLLQLDLQAARSRLALIPQDAVLFSGSIRFNLDPFSQYTDKQLWDALSDAHFADHIRSLPNGLDTLVEEGGKNFSMGQRQLLSLSRAILRHCKVVLMDEVTASIDFRTDRLIQETIRTSAVLRDATIVTVAHRLRTIADSDMIVVVDAGAVVEVGKPFELLTFPEHENSYYRQLALNSGEFEDILRAAKSKVEQPQTNIV